MPTPFISDDPSRDAFRDWESANETGVSLCAEGRWPDAQQAFRDAVAIAPAFADAPAVHAVVLSNLAQADFRLGDTASALANARRALSARLIACDDDLDAPMARIRADLSVYLAASGAFDEAAAALEAARLALEWRYGDEDDRLVTVLENEARIALAAGRPAVAEPALLRLHALLAESGHDPDRLSHLFALVDVSRRPAEGAERAEATSDPFDDHRDADTMPDVFPSILSADAFDIVDEIPRPPLRSPSAQSIRSEGLIEPGQHSTPPSFARTNPLGFEVQYGIPQEILLASSMPLAPDPRDDD
jgi:tetratricopeptide (TPR) repeat protein